MKKNFIFPKVKNKFFALCSSLLFSFTLFGQTRTINFTGGSFDFQFPPNVSTSTISAWGAGGGGGSVYGTNVAKAGGGGGGGAFAQSAFAVTNGTIYSGVAGVAGTAGSGVAGGNGGDSYWNTNSIVAKGGSGGGLGSPTGAGGAGGSLTGTVGTIRFPGGNGAAGVPASRSGGGGGSAGQASAGGNASTTAITGGAAGTGTPAGAAGADGGTGNFTGLPGNVPGSGGSGSRRNNGTQTPLGGAGAAGQVQISYTGYCRPLSSSNATYINALSTAGGNTNISKTATGYGAYGYQNFYYDANGAISIYPGGSFTVTFNLVGGAAGVVIWIDWNGNNIFENSERVYNSAAYLASGNTTTPLIQIPGTSVAGDYVMRIVTDFNATTPDSCTLTGNPTPNATRGEGEDYKLTVATPPNYRVYTTATAPNNTVNDLIDIYFEDYDGINNFYTFNETEVWMHSGLQTSTGTWQYQKAGQDLYDTNTLIKFTRTSAGIPNVYKATVKLADYFCINNGNTIQGVNLIFRNKNPLPPQTGGDYNNQTVDMFLDLGDAAVVVNPPTLAATTNIASNSATINWNAPTKGAVQGYEYYYSTSNTAPTAATVASGSTIATVTSANLTGLSPGTNYYFWVRTKSCNGTSVWSAMGTFTTICGVITAFPHSENFDGVTAPALPNCWTFQDVNGDGSRWTTSTTFPNSTPNALTYSYNATNAANDWAFTPGFNMTAGNSYEISFSYRVRSATWPEQLKVSYGSTASAAGMVNTINDFGSISNTTYQSVTYTIIPSSSGVNYIGFHAYSLANQYDLYVDDFSITELPACTGTPIGGTTVLTPNTGNPLSTFNATVTGGTKAGSLTYQWQSSPTGAAGTWVDIAGATSASATITAVNTETTTYYRRKVTCSGQTSYSTSVPYVTVLNYCSATIGSTSNPASCYIKTVSFRGALNQDVINNTSTYSTTPNGYEDHTSATLVPVQAQGNGLNVFVENSNGAFLKAWVDWNGDGDFEDAQETVYNVRTGINSTTFGFIIPSTVAPGDYRIRFRTNLYATTGAADFISCGIIDRSGETEDYLIRVVANCSAIVTSTVDGINCGVGTVSLGAVASGNPTEFRWYDAAIGGNLIATTTTGSWTTPSINTTTTYYVAAFNGCESRVRIPVKATIKPTPEVSFTPPSATSCGEASVIEVSATGSNEVDHLIDEKFEGGGLGVFTNQFIVNTNGTTINDKTMWTNRTSTYPPAEMVWFPAIASGVNGNKFVMATSDVGKDGLGNPYVIDNALVSPAKSTLSYTNLTFKFKMYYSRYGIAATSDYVNVEASTDGTNWTVVKNILTSIGHGTKFETVTINPAELVAFENKPSVQFRIRYHASWGDGLAVDDVEFYGERPLTPSFVWTGTPVDIYSDAATTTLYANQPIGKIYIKPSIAQMEANTSFNMSAKATLANGCFATGSITVNNDNNIYNSASTDWATAAGWKPSGTVPDITKCVIVRTPVNIYGGANFEAKNVTILSTGSLTINDDPTKSASLKIQNELINKAGINGLLVNSGGNLIQVNDNVVNNEDATVKRNAKLPATQYMYWSSPVTFMAGQNFKTIYAGNPNTLYYNEATAYFGTSSGVNILGRGLALKGTTAAGTNLTATFLGKPYNGKAEYTLAYSGAQYGYNLVGNPYPSNIDLMALYTNNSTKIESTIQFWDNTFNEQMTQLGILYPGDSYAKLNAASGTPTPATNNTKDPSTNAIVGQGFMVRARSSIKTATGTAKNLIFTNSIRTRNNGVFFNRPLSGEGKYWLRMTTPKNNFNTIAVTYSNGATNGYEDFDSRQNNSADMFYSSADNEKLAIQGRQYPFVKNDIVPLGSKQFEAGMHKIEVVKTEGVFAEGQKIYLKDKTSGIVIDLTGNEYSFAAEAGEINDRFEVIYEPETILAAGGNVKEEIQVYRDRTDFVVKAQKRKITAIEVYEAGGKLIYSIRPNNMKTIIDAEKLNNGMYILKIQQNGDFTIRKVLK